MLMKSHISRRVLLATVATFAVAGSARTGTHFLQPAPRLAEPLRSLLALLEPARNSATTIGRVYLAQTPEENDWPILVEKLRAETSLFERRTHESTGLRTALKHQFIRDFSEGRTVSLDGWMVSSTEARLCAILALSA